MSEEEISRLGIEAAEKKSSNITEINDKTISTLQDTVLLKIGFTLRVDGRRYSFVTKRQLCKYAVIAIHIVEELRLFVRQLNELSSNNKPNFQAFKSYIYIYLY